MIGAVVFDVGECLVDGTVGGAADRLSAPSPPVSADQRGQRRRCGGGGMRLYRMQIAKPTVPQTAAICPLTCRDAARGLTLTTYSPDQAADLARGRDGSSTAQPS